jgi:hypothetical protein
MPDGKSILYGDEGMWLTNSLPFARIKELHGVDLPKDFGTRVMHAAVRMNNGGSASFVSDQGLIITNHHVAHEIAADLSTPERNLVRDGFYAARREDELKAPELEVDVLDSITDVTGRVRSADARGAKKAEIAAIEAAAKGPGYAGAVVTLYQGGRYHLYRYRRYRDIRLAFVPEEAIASFGGDFDNYEFPRYALDIAFFRVYDNDVPVRPDTRLTFAAGLPPADTCLFVAGHPGKTDRLTTYAAIQDIGNRSLPLRLGSLRRQEISLQQYAGKSREAARQARHDQFTVENLRKRYMGQLARLQDPTFMGRIKAREDAIRVAVAASPELVKQIGDPWADIERALGKLADIQPEYDLFEAMIGFGGHYDKPNPNRPLRSNWTKYLAIARAILRLAEEDAKPDAERLSEYADAHRESLLAKLYSPAPLYKDFETSRLADALGLVVERYGMDDPFVQELLAGTSAHERARELVEGTALDSPAERKKLVEGGTAAVEASRDPIIALARMIDGRARAARARLESDVQDMFDRAYGKIAEALFLIYGDQVYPDATFTLRIAYGTMQGFIRDGVQVPPMTSVAGTLAHGAVHGFVTPWKLPPSWDLSGEWVAASTAPFDFVTTHDSHGGNSGSPIFTEDFRFVGILFDGVMEGQGSTFLYDDTERAVSVSSAGILAVLTNIYHADALVAELTR